ncbi:CAP Gly-rich domain-containing protein [Flagelloscypha sp. PMI_526]|nr:CAP Gly-rich domain-containing protein [Flagelloscypha sp. PMI_526]
MSIVNIFVLSPDTRSERRIDLHWTVNELKSKLETVTGIPVFSQTITLLNSESEQRSVAQLDDDEKKVGFYGLRDYMALKVDDLNPSKNLTGQLTDVSQVEKFEISDDAYAQRKDSVLAYKQAHKVGRFAEKPEETSNDASAEDIPLGSRCEVESSEEGLSKRGTVRFFGPTKFAGGGVWVGVEYDEPMGKNDGSVQGERYFTCRQNYGVFVRPARLKVGDYPPVDDLELDEM